VVVSAASALPEVIGPAGATVPGEDFAAGVRTVLSWSPAARRAAARERAERFGWATAVGGFLAAHRDTNAPADSAVAAPVRPPVPARQQVRELA
jgi:alpha-1,6-mannosyltransferase